MHTALRRNLWRILFSILLLAGFALVPIPYSAAQIDEEAAQTEVPSRAQEGVTLLGE